MAHVKVYQVLSVVAPIVSVLSAGGVAVYEVRHLQELEANLVKTNKLLAEADSVLQAYANQPLPDRYPTEEKNPKEQALFLDALRANAVATRVRLLRWTNINNTLAGQHVDPTVPKLPAGVEAIVSNVDVSGDYRSMRDFLYNILKTRRLLNLNNIRWVRDEWPTTRLSFTLTRYIGPPSPLPRENPSTTPTLMPASHVTSPNTADNTDWTASKSTLNSTAKHLPGATLVAPPKVVLEETNVQTAAQPRRSP